MGRPKISRLKMPLYRTVHRTLVMFDESALARSHERKLHQVKNT